MPNWSNVVPKSDAPRAMPLRRTPTNGQLRAAITTPDLIGTPTHFFQGHTVPCAGESCKACAEGIGWTWHGYVGAIASVGRQHFIFEFTAQVGDTLKHYRTLQSTLRGGIITAERMHHRPNGRVMLQITPGDLAQLNLPEPPDITACMAVIWNLPRETIKGNGRVKDHPAITIDPDLAIVNRLQREAEAKRNGS